MARVIVHTAKRPHRYVTEKGDEVWICMCGLSDTYPICSGKHREIATEKDDELIVYTQDGSQLRRLDAEQAKLFEGARRI